MMRLCKIFISISLFILTANISFGQSADSMRIDQKRVEINNSNRERQGDALNKARENAPGANGANAVKQVQGARPDMSKARGARPPNIVRPSGSSVPRGMGKPGGVPKRGGR
jgi:hypothetical protein